MILFRIDQNKHAGKNIFFHRKRLKQNDSVTGPSQAVIALIINEIWMLFLLKFEL
jgi:hypothetical protein